MMSRNVQSLYVTRTYGGFLEGTYEMCNRHLRNSIPNQAKRLWGERATHVFWPETDPTKKWPEHVYYAWLDDPLTGPVSGWRPDDPDGRELVVVWFSDEPVGEIEHDLAALVTDELFREKGKDYQI
jgi:hypothetical protein